MGSRLSLDKLPSLEGYTPVPMYYTDDHTAYATLNLIGKHQIILHGKEEYVR